MIDTREWRDIMLVEITNEYIKALLPDLNKNKKITGVLVDIVLEDSPHIYGLYVMGEETTKLLYIKKLRSIYGILVSLLLFYFKLKNTLEEIGFTFNPYDACVGNQMINWKQQTLIFILMIQ